MGVLVHALAVNGDAVNGQVANLAGAAEHAKSSPMPHDRIHRDARIMGGKPCVRGTRIPVEVILEDLSDGMTFADVLAGYENLTEDDLRAALDYAAAYLRETSRVN